MGVTLTHHIDLALIVLYVFWAFFAGLIYYLHQENKREGYPLFSDRNNERVVLQGFPPVPAPKTYLLAHGETVQVPDPRRDDRRPVAGTPAAKWSGAPLIPNNATPLADGIGPGAWAERADVPDLMHDGDAKIVPLRVATDFFPAKEDPDPRGMTVIGGDGKAAGTIADAWVDKSEYIFRYYEIELAGSGRHVLVPVNFCSLNVKRREVTISAILSTQFDGVPATKSLDQVTMLEEEKIMGYYGAGTLYATPARAEPLL